MSLSSAARDLLTTLMIGSSLLWEMMLWLSVPVILKNKVALDTQKGGSLDLKCGKEGGKGRERADPVPDCESAKVANLKCGGPPTMPEENRGPWSKKV